jgi:hypothetical protein
MALPAYASPLERIWYYTYLAICTAVFIFLIAPIVIIIPLSFNVEPYFSFTKKMLALDPEGYSWRWYDLLLTFGVTLGVLALYRFRVLQASAGFKRMMLGATMGIGLFYLGSFLLSLFGVQIGYFNSTSWLAIGVNVAIAGVAALNLVLDFDRIEEGARMGAPKAMEWFAAFGLMVTLIWLYLELLRLLSRLQGRRD